jgi:hypothetical protein
MRNVGFETNLCAARLEANMRENTASCAESVPLARALLYSCRAASECVANSKKSKGRHFPTGGYWNNGVEAQAGHLESRA